MLLISVETSSALGSLSLIEYSEENSSANLIQEQTWVKGKSHSERITEVCLALLKQAQKGLEDIQGIVVGNGPGSFTGLRVGVNFAKTLSYTHSIPIYPLSSLQLLAARTGSQENPVLAFVNAFKNMAYVATYEPKTFKEVLSPRAIKLEALTDLIDSEHVCCGNGLAVFEDQISDDLRQRFISSDIDQPLSSSAATILNHNPLPVATAWNALEPLYIRASEAEEKLKVGLLKPLPKF